MPLTPKGARIKTNMEKQYGPEQGERVFYASANKGTLSGVEPEREPERAPRVANVTRYHGRRADQRRMGR